jgi:ribosome-associated translation inhibitor RaiA
MHFDIQAIDIELPIEARAYLEFRFFSALSRFGSRVFAVRVHVRGAPATRTAAGIHCRVDVILQPEGDVVIEARASRLYAVIDQVADSIASAVDSARSHVA